MEGEPGTGGIDFYGMFMATVFMALDRYLGWMGKGLFDVWCISFDAIIHDKLL